MGTHHRPLAAAVLVTAILVPAGIAQAATKTVDLGLAKAPGGTPETAAFYDFFPAKVKVRAGDKVKYRVNGFGVPYSGPKDQIEPLAIVDPAAPVAGLADPAGQPFWFNGQGTPQINPDFLAPAGDGKVNRGQKDVDRGALALGPSKPLVLTFPRPGTYKVYDALHPFVANTVTVVRKGRVPGRAADRAAAAKQAARLAKTAKRLAAAQPPANTVRVGNDAKKVGFFQFFPANPTVKAGQPLTIDAGSNVYDVHNLAIGPEAFMKANSAEGGLFQPGPAGVALSPATIYPSQPPTGPMTFDGTQNGGYLNTGALDTDAATPLPSKTTITFTKPGTYHYVCLFHSDGVHGMEGMINVVE